MGERLSPEAVAWLDNVDDPAVAAADTTGTSTVLNLPQRRGTPPMLGVPWDDTNSSPDPAWYASSDTKSFIPSPVDLVQEYIMQPAENFNRGLGAGATFGASEGLRALIEGDDYVPPEGWDYMAGDIAGGFMSGGAGYNAVKRSLGAARLINPNNMGRLQRMGTATAEGVATGGLRGMLDPNYEAGEGAVAGGVIAGGMSTILNGGGAAGKGVLRYAAKPHSGLYKVREAVEEASKEYGIPLVATARNIGHSFGEWLENKAAQTSAAHKALMDHLHNIDIGMDRFKDSVLDGMGDFKSYRQNEDAGYFLNNKFQKYIFGDLKDEASKMYTKVMKLGGHEFESVDTTSLVDDMNKVMDKWQNVSSSQAEKVRNFIDRLMPSDSQQKMQHIITGTPRPGWTGMPEQMRRTANLKAGMSARAENTEISLQELWKEATNMYPKKKWGWDDDDFLLVNVSGMVRKHVRKIAGLHPEHGPIFDEWFKQADGLWKKHKDILETDFGKNLMKMDGKPSKTVDSLSKDIESVRDARKFMGDEFTNVLAQRRMMNLVEESMEDLRNPDVISPLTGPRKAGDKHFNYFKFADLLSDLGGSKANSQRYRDVLLQTIPKEAKEAVEKFLSVAKAYEEPYSRLHPKKEAMAGGTEVASIPILISSAQRFGRIVLQFATGKQMAETFVTSGAKTNPLLGGHIPLSPEVGARGTGERILRRGAQGVQRQFQDNDRDNY